MVRALAVLWLAVVLPSGAFGAEIYKPRYREASELAAVAEGILGPSGGAVAADPGTGWLVLRGEADAVAEAIETLQQLDVQPASFRVHTTMTRLVDLDRAGVEIGGWVRNGDVRIGRAGWVPNGIWVRPSGLLAQQESSFQGQVAVLEGNAAEIWTGTTYPEQQTVVDKRGNRVRVYETATLVPVDTGFRVRPRSRADGSIALELAPVISERAEDGTIVRSAAASTVVVKPGETLVIASSRAVEEKIAIDAFAKLDNREGANDSAMLVRVERE